MRCARSSSASAPAAPARERARAAVRAVARAPARAPCRASNATKCKPSPAAFLRRPPSASSATEEIVRFTDEAADLARSEAGPAAERAEELRLRDGVAFRPPARGPFVRCAPLEALGFVPARRARLCLLAPARPPAAFAPDFGVSLRRRPPLAERDDGLLACAEGLRLLPAFASAPPAFDPRLPAFASAPPAFDPRLLAFASAPLLDPARLDFDLPLLGLVPRLLGFDSASPAVDPRLPPRARGARERGFSSSRSSSGWPSPSSSWIWSSSSSSTPWPASSCPGRPR